MTFFNFSIKKRGDITLFSQRHDPANGTYTKLQLVTHQLPDTFKEVWDFLCGIHTYLVSNFGENLSVAV